MCPPILIHIERRDNGWEYKLAERYQTIVGVKEDGSPLVLKCYDNGKTYTLTLTDTTKDVS